MTKRLKVEDNIIDNGKTPKESFNSEEDILLRLKAYRMSVIDYRSCKEVYDCLFPSGTQTLSDMPKSQSDAYEGERWAQKRWDMSERMKLSLEKMRYDYESLERLVDSLSGEYRIVIVKKYFKNETQEQIAQFLNCDRTTVWRWHNKAIEMMVNVATPFNVESPIIDSMNNNGSHDSSNKNIVPRARFSYLSY